MQVIGGKTKSRNESVCCEIARYQRRPDMIYEGEVSGNSDGGS